MTTLTESDASAEQSGILPSISRGHKVRLAQIAIVAVVILFIEIAPRVGIIEETTFIPFTVMVGSLKSLVLSGKATPHLVQTFTAVLGAFGLGIVTGIPAGIVLWKAATLKEILDPYLLIYYAVPFFVFYPLLISIMGMGILPILTIAWGFSVVIIITNTASGLNEIPDSYVLAGRDMNLSSWQLLRYIYMPASVPYVFTGLKLGFVYALIGTIASEFILAENGLGWLISYSYNYFDITTMYASILLVLLLALTTNAILSAIENRLYSRVRT